MAQAAVLRRLPRIAGTVRADVLILTAIMRDATSGPLVGLRVLELGGVGPVPHAGMMLGDLGADVIRIQRPDAFALVEPSRDHLLRSRHVHALDLKDASQHACVRRLADATDVVLEGFRPGIAERLGVGPSQLTRTNPGLVYGRMTGWGQEGILSHAAGHDINYIALNGTLHAMGPQDAPPYAPLNLVGDFGGGSMMLLVGVLGALWERERSGLGQVVDAAMIDGSALLMQAIWAWRGVGDWTDQRSANLLDGAAPFYRCYTCADGKYIAVGAIEPQFYSDLLKGLQLMDQELPAQNDRAGWPVLASRFGKRFATRRRDEWVTIFASLDACVTPVLDFSEATSHAHARSRGAFVELEGVTQPAPAPRFSRTPQNIPTAPTLPSPVEETLKRWGCH